MNFIITNDCNKGCPYCFASTNRQLVPDNERHMKFEMFKEYIDKIPDKNRGIKLLGGEPTQHPEFKKFFQHILDRNRSVTLISNFLFEDDIKDFIIEKIRDGYANRIHFLINSTTLDVGKTRMQTFKNNYNSIYQVLYEINYEENLSCGITIEEDKDLKYYLQYIDFLKENLYKIERLRISLPFPGDEKDKGPEKIINNKDMGNKIVSIVYKAINSFIKPSIDCIILPCMFENKEELKLIKKFAEQVRYRCGENAPTDIFSDNTMSYCYPLRETVKININKYKNLIDSSNALISTYKIIEDIVEKPDECKTCSYFKSRECNGPCLGFYNIKNIMEE